MDILLKILKTLWSITFFILKISFILIVGFLYFCFVTNL